MSALFGYIFILIWDKNKRNSLSIHKSVQLIELLIIMNYVFSKGNIEKWKKYKSENRSCVKLYEFPTVLLSYLRIFGSDLGCGEAIWQCPFICCTL